MKRKLNCAASQIWVRIRRALKEPLFDHYRPERHYMRGPGPKSQAKAKAPQR